jgi:hypothetical protein
MAYERDETGCYLEPSERVRQAAARALEICCPNTAPVVIEPEPIPGPAVPDREELPQQPQIPDREEAPLPPVTGQEVYHPAINPVIDTTSDQLALGADPLGVVVYADTSRNIAHVHFQQQNLSIPTGTQLLMMSPLAETSQVWGELEVVESFVGSANVRCVSASALERLQPGHPVVLVPAPVVKQVATADHPPVDASPAPVAPLRVDPPAPVVDAAAMAQRKSAAPVPTHVDSRPASTEQPAAASTPPLPKRSMAERSSRRVQPPLPAKQLGHKVSFRAPQ